MLQLQPSAAQHFASFSGSQPLLQESARFCVKWGSQGSFNRQKAQRFLEIVERYWDAMTGPLGYDQTRGINKEKRRDYKMNIYIAGKGKSWRWPLAALCRAQVQFAGPLVRWSAVTHAHQRKAL